MKRTDDLPDNIFGQKREHVAPVRRGYKLLFTLLLNSGLRISEALGLKVQDVRLQDGAAKSVRVIGKGNRERIVPLPEDFGQVLGFWLKDRPRGEFAFAQHPAHPAGGPRLLPPPAATGA
ncbi:MAG: tyrosine-type recombinase/integrase, partial [Candidatus Contendobacter sp.]|nr:tyrosine-type recombinase/integrase [Candidatus Contendobacter sp.]